VTYTFFISIIDRKQFLLYRVILALPDPVE